MKNILRRASLPFKYLLLIISYLFPRNKKIWCFGASFNGNAKYLFLYMSKNMREDYHSVWIGEQNDVERVKSLGLEAYTTWSLKGLYFCLLGKVYVYNSYPANVNLYTMGGAKLVNLWHGVALKCIDRQIKDGPTAKYYQSKGIINEIRYLNFRKHADVILSTSPLMTENFSEAFDVPNSKIVEGIYPRCYLFSMSKEEIISYVKNNEDSKMMDFIRKTDAFAYTYIYMPTWRDTGDDFIHNCGFDFDVLNETMKKNNRFFILKIHPDSKFKFEDNYSNIMILDKDIDIYPILPFTDCLITDFSSIYFDYLLLEQKQIILFLPDFDDYINKNRTLKYPYDDVMKGIKAFNFSQLMEFLHKDNPVFDIPGKKEVKERFWNPQYHDMRQLVEGINEKLWS